MACHHIGCPGLNQVQSHARQNALTLYYIIPAPFLAFALYSRAPRGSKVFLTQRNSCILIGGHTYLCLGFTLSSAWRTVWYQTSNLHAQSVETVSNPIAHNCCQALDQEKGTPFFLEFLSQCSRLQVPPSAKKVQEKQGTHRVWLGWASPSSAYIYIGT